ncbi:MAG: septum formation initiator family protein [Erysipelotrichaceae bacterium]|nr:septum formation initiator family protein [Erysipelotrichaceae bacterium]
MTQQKRVMKKKKKLTPVVKLICISLIGVSVYLFYLSFKEIFTMTELKESVAQAEKRLQEVTDENTYLVSQRDKLEDPDYVQSYARSNYMLTKEGENIYYLPSSDK